MGVSPLIISKSIGPKVPPSGPSFRLGFDANSDDRGGHAHFLAISGHKIKNRQISVAVCITDD